MSDDGRGEISFSRKSTLTSYLVLGDVMPLKTYPQITLHRLSGLYLWIQESVHVYTYATVKDKEAMDWKESRGRSWREEREGGMI